MTGLLAKSSAALLAAVLLGTATAVVAQVAEPAVTWNGITLGGAASSLRSSIGDPLRISLFNDGTRRIARYWVPGMDTTYFLIIEEHGYVVGFDGFSEPAPTAVLENVPPDPTGVRVGDTLEAVKTKHPDFRAGVDDDGAPYLIGKASPTVAVVYSFEGGRVSRFQWGTKLPADRPELSPLSEPSGASPSNAILDVQKNEADGTAWEYRYLAFHPCADGSRRQLKKQALVNDRGRSYDVLHVVCPATKAERDFFFDITSYFGKL